MANAYGDYRIVSHMLCSNATRAARLRYDAFCTVKTYHQVLGDKNNHTSDRSRATR